ncbi:MAG: ABC transporter substrate-binding protein, partial [Anaerolineales bacterium]
RHAVEEYGKVWSEVGNIVTNGPFKLESWQPGKSIVLVRNEDYQRRIGGNLQRVELRLLSIADLVQAEEYESDNLDVINLWGLIPEKLDRMKHRHFGEYVSSPVMTTYYIGFNAARSPFDNPSVRQAFVMATDRIQFLQGALSLYPPPTGGFIPPGMPGHSPGIGLACDPKRAQQLMAESGYPEGDGFPVIEVIFPTEGDQSDVQLLHKKFFQTQWHENLGIESKWEFLEFRAFLSRFQSEQPDMYFMGWSADYPDPYNFLAEASCLKWTGWQDDVYDRLQEISRRIQDQAERLRLLQEADRILMDEAPIMPLYYGRSHLLVKPWVKRYVEDWKDIILEPH